jgi:hypothetical protein
MERALDDSTVEPDEAQKAENSGDILFLRVLQTQTHTIRDIKPISR